MKKRRILSVFLIIGVVIGNIFWKPCYVKAIESGYDKITEINDDLLAAKLVAKNFVNTIATEKNGWEQNNYLGNNYTVIYNLKNEECGYIFNVINNNESSGYVVVGNVKNAYEIIEYSFENNSINDFCNVNEKDNIYLVEGYNYLKQKDGKYITQDLEEINIHDCKDLNISVKAEQKEQANELIQKLKNMDFDEKNILWDDISSGKSKSINNDGGEITSIQEYLKNYVGESYTYTYSDANSNVLSGTGTYTMEELDSDEANCCTLVALANAMIYYRNKKGYSSIPISNNILYMDIKAKATNLGYTDADGLSVSKNNNLVNNIFSSYGYSVTGSNNYGWTNTSVKNAIDNYGPALMSFASGYYYNHTVMIYGYKTYNASSGSSYVFFLVRDGWNSGVRYVAGAGACSYVISCLTTIKA